MDARLRRVNKEIAGESEWSAIAIDNHLKPSVLFLRRLQERQDVKHQD